MGKGKRKKGARDEKSLPTKPVADLSEAEAASELARLAAEIRATPLGLTRGVRAHSSGGAGSGEPHV